MKLNNLRTRVTALLAAAAMAAALAPAALAEGELKTVKDETALRSAIAENANIVLGSDIELTSNLAISVNGVTIDGGENHYKIYADDDFNQAIDEGQPGDSSVNSLVTVTGDSLTLKNITLETGKKNAHVLNLFEARRITLDNVALDHTDAYKGASLVVASSEVTARNGLSITVGANSWYGINLDNGTASNVGNAQLTFEDNKVSFTNETGKDLLLVQLDNKKDDDTVANTIVNPGNAGLTEKGPSGQYLPEVITVTTEDGLRAAAALEDANIVLGGNIKLLNNVEVTADHVTIDGSDYKIYADTDFKQTVTPNQDGDSAANSLFTVSGDKVVLKNITVETGANNVHALNLYEAQNTTLENVTLDHTKAYKGAPLVVNSSTAAVKGSFKTITGAKSWYAINLDNKSTTDPSIDFTQATSVTFDKAEDTTAKFPLYTELAAQVDGVVKGADKAGIVLSSGGLFIPSEIPVSTVDELKTAMLLENANIVLQNDIKLTSNLMVPTAVVAPATPAKNITINGNGHKIYADGTFVQTVQPNQSGDSAANSLVTVTGKDITLKNITLQTGTKNVHALNLYQAENVVLDNVVLDHTNS